MKTNVQQNKIFWQPSGSLAAGASVTSGSISCDGYARITGLFYSSASAKAGSGLRVSQSANGGTNYDFHTDFAPSACSGSSFSVEVVGDVAKVDFIADSQADEYRAIWSLRPVSVPPAYSGIVQQAAPANLLAYWVLYGDSRDSSGYGYNGADIGAPVYGQIGIGDGLTAVFTDGSNDAINVWSTGYRDVFDDTAKDEGSLLAWGRVGSGAWADGATRDLVRFQAVGGNDIILIQKLTTSLFCLRRANGTTKSVTQANMTTEDWISVILTWSVSADEFKVFLNGEQIGTTQTSNVAWSAAVLSGTNTLIGAASTTPTLPWHGDIAHIAIWDTPLTATQISTLTNF